MWLFVCFSAVAPVTARAWSWPVRLPLFPVLTLLCRDTSVSRALLTDHMICSSEIHTHTVHNTLCPSHRKQSAGQSSDLLPQRTGPFLFCVIQKVNKQITQPRCCICSIKPSLKIWCFWHVVLVIVVQPSLYFVRLHKFSTTVKCHDGHPSFPSSVSTLAATVSRWHAFANNSHWRHRLNKQIRVLKIRFEEQIEFVWTKPDWNGTFSPVDLGFTETERFCSTTKVLSTHV